MAARADDGLDISLKPVLGKTFVVLPAEPTPDRIIWPEYGKSVETYLGIDAFSNGTGSPESDWQCTELVHRFVSDVFGIPSRIGWGMGHGKDLAAGLVGYHKNRIGSSERLGDVRVRLEYFKSGSTAYPPVTGSIVSMYFNNRRAGFGHVGMIRQILSETEDEIVGVLFDQHGFINNNYVGRQIQADHVVFRRDADGKWTGWVRPWRWPGEEYAATGWTTAVMAEH